MYNINETTTIKVDPFKENQIIEIGYQRDNDAVELEFEGLTGTDNWVCLVWNKKYMYIPIPDYKLPIEEEYTIASNIYKMQIVKLSDNGFKSHSPFTTLKLKISAPNKYLEEHVPGPFEPAYKIVLATTETIENKLAAGEFDGVGISRIEKTRSEGKVDFYTITFTDETAFEYRVKNGEDYNDSAQFKALAQQVKTDAGSASQAAQAASGSASQAAGANSAAQQAKQAAMQSETNAAAHETKSGTNANQAQTSAQEAETSAGNAQKEANRAKTEADKAAENSELALQTAIKPTFSGNPVSISDSIDYKLLKVGAKGSTTQEVRSGKNLINPKEVNRYGGNQWNLPYLIQDTKELVLSLNKNLSIIEQIDLATNKAIKTVYNNNKMVFNSKPNTIIRVDASQRFESAEEVVDTLQIQIEVGSEATSYEPFGKAPTPEFPTPVVNGMLKKISNTGKNLLNPKIFNDNYYGNIDDSIIIKSIDYRSWDSISTLPIFFSNGDYLFSFFGCSADVKINDLPPKRVKLNESYTIYLNAKDKIKIKLFAPESDSLPVECKVVIQADSVVTSYEPYKGQVYKLSVPIELSKWDRIEDREGIVGKVTKSNLTSFTGDEDFTLNYFPEVITPLIKKGVSRYRAGYSNIITRSDLSFSNSLLNKITLNFRDYPEITKENVIQKIKDLNTKGTPLTVCYETEEETFEPLPEADQQIFKSLKTYAPNTTLTTDTGVTLEGQYIANGMLYTERRIKEEIAKLSQQNAQQLTRTMTLMPDDVQAAMIDKEVENTMEETTK